MIRSALFDPTAAYRYFLDRNWARLYTPGPERVTWIMLNPSTADAFKEDPTIKRCMSFSTLWGYDSLAVVNLYAYRATNPKRLLEISDPVGPDNLKHIKQAIEGSRLVIAAWGAFKLGVPESLRSTLQDSSLFCLGTTKDGHPKHPLYVKAATQRERFVL